MKSIRDGVDGKDDDEELPEGEVAATAAKAEAKKPEEEPAKKE
jgi:hypothetical protein